MQTGEGCMNYEYLKSLLSYDPETGDMKWKVNRSRVKKGDSVGSIDRYGYRTTMIDKKNYKVHRLIWLLTYGYMPALEIDHINGVKDDNRIANLRLASKDENARNRPMTNRSSTGLKGVFRKKKTNKFTSSIYVSGKSIYLGTFNTPEEAYSAYCEAAKNHHGTFANIN